MPFSFDVRPDAVRAQDVYRVSRRALLSSIMSTLATSLVADQAWAARAIRLIAQEPGAQTDTVARTILPALESAMRQEIVIENHGGAGGRIAARTVATASPDGMVVGLGGANNLVLAGLLGRDIGYDPGKDFSFICSVARIPFAIAVRSSLPLADLDDWVKYARAHPGKLTFGSAGVGGSSHLAVEAVAQHFQLSLLHIPFRGSSLATNEVVAERIDIVATDLHRLLPLAKSGKVRIIAVTGSARSKHAPNVATLHEQGLTGFYLDPWYGLYGPRGIDPTMATRWRAAVSEAQSDKATIARAEAASIELVSPSFDTLTRWIDVDRARFRELAKKIDLTTSQ
jgi:tripartite-type tricarboxylate transporter receptor subunit TctC